MKFIISLVLFLAIGSMLCIQVGGTMTQDTVWGPNDNPIQVLDHVIINEGVTLTILPGTEIYFRPRQILTFEQYMAGVEYDGGTSEHKIIWCNGNIIAEGTENNPILFTRMNDEEKTFWGGILLFFGSQWGVFKHCIFEYTTDVMLYPGSWMDAAISIRSGNVIVNNCRFYNCWGSILKNTREEEIEVVSCDFYRDDDLFYTDTSIPVDWNMMYFSRNNNTENAGLIANCSFYNFGGSNTPNIQWSFNSFDSLDSHSAVYNNYNYNFFYKNTFTNQDRAISVPDNGYIRSNRFIGGDESIRGGIIHVVDNYFENNRFQGDFGSRYISNVYNNAEGAPSITCLANEITYELYEDYAVGGLDNNHNNLGVDCEFGVRGGTFYNSIVVGNDNICEDMSEATKSFKNCIIDFPLGSSSLVDLGGNIYVDPDSIANLFVDYEGRDFRPAPGSPAIDAGCWVDTLNWCEYAGGFTERFWDGDGDGIAQPDIGPYEYGAPALGGIKGYTRKSTGNNEIVPYVLIHNAYDYSEFVISDSLGYYELPLTAGRYEFVVQRVFYDSLYVHKQVNADYSWNESDIYLVQNTTYNDEYEISPQLSSIEVTNFPNPFNPSTTISYSIPESGDVEVTVFNVRGQLVKQLYKGFKPKGGYNIKWDGTDEHNNTVATGVYFSVVKTNKEQKSNKMLLMK